MYNLPLYGLCYPPVHLELHGLNGFYLPLPCTQLFPAWDAIGYTENCLKLGFTKYLVSCNVHSRICDFYSGALSPYLCVQSVYIKCKKCPNVNTLYTLKCAGLWTLDSKNENPLRSILLTLGKPHIRKWIFGEFFLSGILEIIFLSLHPVVPLCCD